MTSITRYTAADLPALMERITRNSIGMDEYFDRLFNLHETTTNYPPYNLVQVNNVESPNRIGRLSTREWLAEVLNERGLYPTTQKSGKSHLKTDFYGSYLGK